MIHSKLSRSPGHQMQPFEAIPAPYEFRNAHTEVSYGFLKYGYPKPLFFPLIVPNHLDDLGGNPHLGNLHINVDELLSAPVIPKTIQSRSRIRCWP